MNEKVRKVFILMSLAKREISFGDSKIKVEKRTEHRKIDCAR